MVRPDRSTDSPGARRSALALLAAAAIALATPARGSLAEEVSALAGDFSAAGVTVEMAKGVQTLRAGDRAIPLAEVKGIRYGAADPADDASLARVYVGGGDLLRGALAGGKNDEEVVVRSPSLGDLTLKLSSVRGVLLAATSRAARAFEQDDLLRKLKDDAVHLRAGGSYQGLVERIGADGVKMRANDLGDLPPIPFDKLRAILLAELGPPPKRPDELHVRVDLRDGSTVSGRLISLDPAELKVATFFAPALAIRTAAVASVFVRNGRVVYLSDLEPKEVKEAAYWIGTVFPFQRDRNCLGNPIRLDGRTYAKGLGVHARAELAYDLGGRFKEFRSLIGLDDEAREAEASVPVGVVFQVIVDGKPHFQGGLPMSREDRGRFVAVDLAGAKELRLIADFAPHGSPDTLSRADWADAHLVRE